MTYKIVGVILSMFVVLAFTPGCQADRIEKLEQELQKEQDEKSDLQSELTDAIKDLESSNTLLDETDKVLQEVEENCKIALEDMDKQIEVVEERNKVLEGEIIDLRQPPLDIKGGHAGSIGFWDTVEFSDEFFPDAYRKVGSYSGKGPYQLATLEDLEMFLANDHINNKYYPYLNDPRRSSHDAVAFTLKERWISSGLPPWSFCLVKVWREVPGGSMIDWWNVFFTKENGEYVFYGIDWRSDEIIKFAPGEYGGWDVCLVIICDRIM